VNPEYYPAVKVASLPRGGRGHFTALWFGRMGGPILAHRWAINTILGESYCQWIEDVPAFEDATNFCIREKLQSMWSKAFWTNIVIAFLNRRPTLRENIRFFGTPLHFYNYVQVFVGVGARVHPGTKMWRESAEAFTAALEFRHSGC